MYEILHGKYLPDIKIDTYLGLVLATHLKRLGRSHCVVTKSNNYSRQSAHNV